MPMPLWWGQINKRVFNPRGLRNGKLRLKRSRGSPPTPSGRQGS